MAIEMKTLRQLYEEQAVEYRADAQALREATDYTKQYVKFAPNICDSSNRASTRIAWVERAERAFIEKHKREILQLAADLCEEAIGEPEAVRQDNQHRRGQLQRQDIPGE